MSQSFAWWFELMGEAMHGRIPELVAGAPVIKYLNKV